MKKRLISLLLAFSMVLTFLPIGAVSAFADDGVDESKGTMIPNNLGKVYEIKEDGTTYQMSGEYDAPIEIFAKNVTINITGNVEYTGSFPSHNFLLRVQPGAQVTVYSSADYTVSADKGSARGIIKVFSNGADVQGEATFYGGNFKSVDYTTFFISGGILRLENVNATVESDFVVNSHNGDFIATNSTLESTQYIGIYNRYDGRVTLNKVTLIANNGYGLYNERGETTINGGEYTNTFNFMKGILTINSGTFTGVNGRSAIVNERTLYFNGGTASSESGTAILTRIDPNRKEFDAVTEITGGTVQNSTYGLRLMEDSGGYKTVLKLGNAKFSGNDTDIYLAADKKIAIEDTFTDTAKVKVADATPGRRITTGDDDDYQKDLKLTSLDDAPNGRKYLIGWKQENGQECRYLAEHTGYTVTAEKATATLDGTLLYSYDEIEAGKGVTLTADAPEDGWVFAGWQVTEGGLTLDDTADTVTFQMPTSNVVVSAQYEYVGTPDAAADNIKGALSAVVVGAAAGAIIYEAGTGIYRVINMPGIPMPSNRIELAELLWERADKPEPVSTALYDDIDEDDTDAQKAAHWAVEQDLMQDDEDDNEFHPHFPVSKLRTCLTWNAAKEKGLFDTDKTAE